MSTRQYVGAVHTLNNTLEQLPLTFDASQKIPDSNIMDILASNAPKSHKEVMMGQGFDPQDKVLLQVQQIIFQITFALHAAKEERELKHYNVKLLNVFLQLLPPTGQEHTILRYGLGNNVFALEIPTASGFIAKLGEPGNFGEQASVDISVSVWQFTTFQNTLPESPWRCS